MTTLSIMNYKGGVAKTSLKADIASEYAYPGKKVLLIVSLAVSGPHVVLSKNPQRILKRKSLGLRRLRLLLP
ncbi:AAA family ATPase [Rossellomorea sp. GCM10028870]|uniref:AAA family ATPase n=1 Tax=Rossellomorea sp. GCM10028870 TaxID=3273426 RepID=UPI0036189C78